MLLEPLASTIETIKSRIERHGTSLRENEIRTRMALIDPLLQALGWDTSDPALVLPEYDVSGRKADYALLGDDGSPATTVEAKKLGEPLSPHRMQMLNYSNASGVEFAGLTDGDRWELYEVFQRGQLEDRRILEVSIASEPTHEVALKLLRLWRPNLASGQPVAASAPVLYVMKKDTPTTETRVVNSILPDLVGRESAQVVGRPMPESLPTATKEGWMPLSALFPHNGDPPASAIRFSDGSEFGLRKAWMALVESTAAWLWSTGLLTFGNVPVKSSEKRYIVNTEPLHPKGNRFKQSKQIEGTPLWTERNVGCRVSSTNARNLLQLCGVSPDTVFLRFE